MIPIRDGISRAQQPLILQSSSSETQYIKYPTILKLGMQQYVYSVALTRDQIVERYKTCILTFVYVIKCQCKIGK